MAALTHATEAVTAPSAPTVTADSAVNIASASTPDELVTIFKQLAVHPIHRPAHLLAMARERRTKPCAAASLPSARASSTTTGHASSTDSAARGGSCWTKDVAKSFGSALKAAKHLAGVEACFVEALHPRWNRWRCARVLAGDNDFRCLNSAGCNSNAPTGSRSASIDMAATQTFSEWPWSQYTTGTGLRPATAARAKELLQYNCACDEEGGNNGVGPESNTIDLLFYDGEIHRDVSQTDCKRIDFSAVALLEATDQCNYLRLVQLMRAGVLLSEVLRLGCSLIISQTVGDTHVRDDLCSIGLVQVITRALKTDAHMADGGGLMEQLARVLMNLACSDAGVVLMGQVGAMERIVECVKMPMLELHAGFMYASIKLIHNMCIGHDAHRIFFLHAGMLRVINGARARFPENAPLQSWSGRTISAMQAFDQEEVGLMVLGALATIEQDEELSVLESMTLDFDGADPIAQIMDQMLSSIQYGEDDEDEENEEDEEEEGDDEEEDAHSSEEESEDEDNEFPLSLLNL